MRNNMGMSRERNKEVDEVEELLRAAEDEMLLNLNTNSHMAHTSSLSPLDEDLVRRFEALKSSSSSKLSPGEQKEKTEGGEKLKKTEGGEKLKKTEGEEKLEKTLESDLLARFSALKGPSSFSEDLPPFTRRSSGDDNNNNNKLENDEISDSEVEKVMQWAIDAARLDPSQTDDENQEDEEEEDYEEDDMKDDEEIKQKQRK